MARTPHDELFHELLRHGPWMGRWLAGFLPQGLLAELDLDSVEPADARTIGFDLRPHLADRVVLVRRRTSVPGECEHVLVDVEHRSKWSPDLHDQQLRYVVHLRHAHMRCGRATPAVLAVALCHGPTPVLLQGVVGALGERRVPVASGCSGLLADLAPTLPVFLDDLASVTEQQLRERNLPPAVLLAFLCLRTLRTCNATEALAALDRFGDVVRAVAEGEDGAPLPAAVLDAIGWYALSATELTEEQVEMVFGKYVPDPEMTRMTTARRIREESARHGREVGFQEGRQEGRQEGQQEGRLQGRVELLLCLLEHRFGTVSPAVEARARAATSAQLDAYARRVFDAPSLEAVFAD